PRPVNLGGSWGLRGYPRYGYVAGTRAWLVNSEWRFPITDFLTIGFPFGAARFPGVQGALFLDVGGATSVTVARRGILGSSRIGPPDSLRFDYVGPLGLGAGAAVVVGDSAIWADPEKNFRSIVPAVRMLWAGLGMVRPPAPGAAISGLNTPPVTIWRFAQDAD